MSDLGQSLESICQSVRVKTIELHIKAPATRIASSLSSVEIFVALYYGGCLQYKAQQPKWVDRDRLIISKGHGSICLYPILADLGFFPAEELLKAGEYGSFLGGIPDPDIPGYETINGSLGHGLGIGVGTATYLGRQRGYHISPKVYVVISDGELYEGSTWEALMLAGAQRLSNLCVIVDNNRTSMLDRTNNIIPLENLVGRFQLFGWRAFEVDGHDVHQLVSHAQSFNQGSDEPTVIVANTKKGKGVKVLEDDPLSHIANLNEQEARYAIDEILGRNSKTQKTEVAKKTAKEKLEESRY
jgi:transketolase